MYNIIISISSPPTSISFTSFISNHPLYPFLSPLQAYTTSAGIQPLQAYTIYSSIYNLFKPTQPLQTYNLCRHFITSSYITSAGINTVGKTSTIFTFIINILCPTLIFYIYIGYFYQTYCTYFYFYISIFHYNHLTLNQHYFSRSIPFLIFFSLVVHFISHQFSLSYYLLLLITSNIHRIYFIFINTLPVIIIIPLFLILKRNILRLQFWTLVSINKPSNTILLLSLHLCRGYY